MSTRVCKKCGWVYPMTQRGLKCVVCGEPFDDVVCRKCGRLVSGSDRVPGRPLCKECHNAEERVHMVKYIAKVNEGFEQRYKDWLARIAAVSKNYPVLTEAQWMEACRYFNGCAQCGSDEIEARGFFIHFKQGGRYCDWNVIPLCERCAADWKLSPNPFRAATYRDRNNRSFDRRKCLEKIVEYLGGKLNDACSALQDTAKNESSSEHSDP